MHIAYMFQYILHVKMYEYRGEMVSIFMFNYLHIHIYYIHVNTHSYINTYTYLYMYMYYICPILHGNMYEDRGEMVRIFMYMYKYVSFYISLNLYTSRHYLYIFIILCILI
jgi:hypothetical protein